MATSTDQRSSVCDRVGDRDWLMGRALVLGALGALLAGVARAERCRELLREGDEPPCGPCLPGYASGQRGVGRCHFARVLAGFAQAGEELLTAGPDARIVDADGDGLLDVVDGTEMFPNVGTLRRPKFDPNREESNPLSEFETSYSGPQQETMVRLHANATPAVAALLATGSRSWEIIAIADGLAERLVTQEQLEESMGRFRATKPPQLAFGDLNGDAVLDIAVSWPDTGVCALLVGVRTQEGTGVNFQVQTEGHPLEPLCPETHCDLHFVDYSGDGFDDVMALNATSAVRFFANRQGDLTELAGQDNPFGDTRLLLSKLELELESIMMIDLTGDGHDDMVLATSPQSSEWTLQLHRMAGVGASFTPNAMVDPLSILEPILPDVETICSSAASGDVFVKTASQGLQSFRAGPNGFYNTSEENLLITRVRLAPSEYDASASTWFAVIDINGDGEDDLIGGEAFGDLIIVSGRSGPETLDPYSSVSVELPGGTVTSGTAADLNGDELVDSIWCAYQLPGYYGDYVEYDEEGEFQLYIGLNSGSKTVPDFQTVLSVEIGLHPVEPPPMVVAADLDGEGEVDVLVWMQDSSMLHFRWRQGTLERVPRESSVLPAVVGFPSMTAVDFDDDGDLDLVFWDQSGFRYFTNTAAECASDCTRGRGLCAQGALDRFVFREAAKQLDLKVDDDAGLALAAGTCICGEAFVGRACEQCSPEYFGQACEQKCPQWSETRLAPGEKVFPDAPVQDDCTCKWSYTRLDLEEGGFVCVCTAGRYFNTDGQLCQECEIGSFSTEQAWQESCVSCTEVLAGSTTTITGAANASACLCAPGTWKDDTRAECRPCPENSMADQPDVCPCAPSFYRVDDASESGYRCELCLEGADCTEGAASLASLKLRPGYWRIDGNSTMLYKCENEFCDAPPEPGVVHAGDAICAEGHRGALCSGCKPDFAMSRLTGCQRCDTERTAEHAALLVLYCLLLCLLLALPAAFVVFKWCKGAKVARDRDPARPMCGVRGVRAYVSLLTGKVVMILISFSQVHFALLAATMRGVKQTPSSSVMFVFFSVDISMVLEAFHIGCALQLDFFMGLLVYSLAPVAAVAIAATVVLALSRRSSHASAAKQPVEALPSASNGGGSNSACTSGDEEEGGGSGGDAPVSTRTHLLQTLLLLVIKISVLVYPGVSARVVQAFLPRWFVRQDGDPVGCSAGALGVLRTAVATPFCPEPGVRDVDDWYPIIMVLLAAYPVLVPVMIGFFIWRAGRPGVHGAWQAGEVLTAPYNSSGGARWTEVVSLIAKFWLIPGFLLVQRLVEETSFRDALAIAYFMVGCMVLLAGLSWVKPYRDPLLQQLAERSVMLLGLSGLLASALAPERNNSDVIIGGFFVVWVVQLCLSVLYARRVLVNGVSSTSEERTKFLQQEQAQPPAAEGNQNVCVKPETALTKSFGGLPESGAENPKHPAGLVLPELPPRPAIPPSPTGKRTPPALPPRRVVAPPLPPRQHQGQQEGQQQEAEPPRRVLPPPLPPWQPQGQSQQAERKSYGPAPPLHAFPRVDSLLEAAAQADGDGVGSDDDAGVDRSAALTKA